MESREDEGTPNLSSSLNYWPVVYGWTIVFIKCTDGASRDVSNPRQEQRKHSRSGETLKSRHLK
jgi:hypothetical protein